MSQGHGDGSAQSPGSSGDQRDLPLQTKRWKDLHGLRAYQPPSWRCPASRDVLQRARRDPTRRRGPAVAGRYPSRAAESPAEDQNLALGVATSVSCGGTSTSTSTSTPSTPSWANWSNEPSSRASTPPSHGSDTSPTRPKRSAKARKPAPACDTRTRLCSGPSSRTGRATMPQAQPATAVQRSTATLEVSR